MKITVLGPWGAYPAAGGATAGYLLEFNGNRVLLDCGSGVLSILQNYMPLNELGAVVISHTHHDHVADLGCLQYACIIDTDLNKRTKALPIYVAGLQPTGHNPYPSMEGSEVVPFFENEILHLHGMTFSFLKTFHGAYCLAMKIQSGSATIVYTADTYYDDSLIGFCADADLLIAETSFYAGQDAKKYGHMNSEEVGHLAQMAKVKKVVLTHLPHFGDIADLEDEVRVKFRGEVVLAATGLQFEV